MAFLAFVIEVDGMNVSFSIYRDGALLNILTSTAGMQAVPRRYLGVRSATGSLCFEGTMDEFRIYSRILSSEEILELAKGLPLDSHAPNSPQNLAARGALGHEHPPYIGRLCG